MNSFSLFTDVSLDPRRKLGVGAYLIVPASFMEVPPHSIERSAVAGRLVVKRFEDTSSTMLEVQTVLYALEDFRNELKVAAPVKLQIYSDSQCVAGLLGRRKGLEAGRFISKGKNREITNASLYREFYEFHDVLGFKVIKVAGHTRSCSHDTVHHIFSCVDREVRQALKLWMVNCS
jgi:ribonuclease HI